MKSLHMREEVATVVDLLHCSGVVVVWVHDGVILYEEIIWMDVVEYIDLRYLESMIY